MGLAAIGERYRPRTRLEERRAGGIGLAIPVYRPADGLRQQGLYKGCALDWTRPGTSDLLPGWDGCRQSCTFCRRIEHSNPYEQVTFP